MFGGEIGDHFLQRFVSGHLELLAQLRLALGAGMLLVRFPLCDLEPLLQCRGSSFSVTEALRQRIELTAGGDGSVALIGRALAERLDLVLEIALSGSCSGGGLGARFRFVFDLRSRGRTSCCFKPLTRWSSMTTSTAAGRSSGGRSGGSSGIANAGRRIWIAARVAIVTMAASRNATATPVEGRCGPDIQPYRITAATAVSIPISTLLSAATTMTARR